VSKYKHPGTGRDLSRLIPRAIIDNDNSIRLFSQSTQHMADPRLLVVSRDDDPTFHSHHILMTRSFSPSFFERVNIANG
jgi:hypothetical protein